MEHSGGDQVFSAEVLIKLDVLLGVSKKSIIKKLTKRFGAEVHTVTTGDHTWKTATLFGEIAVFNGSPSRS